ncbi:Fc.00g071290.m01.CDS01 [Cosmosporella sp. VM-42]
MLSQIIRFTLPHPLTISAPGFMALRQKVSAAGAVAQYYGYSVPTSSPLPKKRHEICWAIHWADACDRSSIVGGLSDLGVGDATSLLFKFADTQVPELQKALEAPVCEFANITLVDDAPLSDPELQKSMHKTYADTYQIRGFTGGYWAYATNSNHINGQPVSGLVEEEVAEGQRRLAVYQLGWESIELHQDGTKTAQFAEEIDKLMPYFGPGTGAWYVTFRKH